MKFTSTIHLDDFHVKKLSSDFPWLEVQHAKKLSLLSEKEMAEIEILLTYGNDLPESVVEKMDCLKWIHIAQSGAENLPFGKLMGKNVVVTNSRGINAVTIAEYTIGMMINVIRNNYIFYESQKRHEWNMHTTLEEIHGKVLGIIGMGTIGRELARIAKAMGMYVIGLKRSAAGREDNVDTLLTAAEKEVLFRESDFIVTLIPLTEDTMDFVSQKEFEQMKRTAYLLNISRGKVVNENALVSCLQNKRIAGAVLDVFQEEPLPADHILWTLDNVIITPHIAGDRHPQYIPRVYEILSENLRCYPKDIDSMVNKVNLKQGF